MVAEKLPYRLEPGTNLGSRLQAIAHSLADRILADLETDQPDPLVSAYDARKKLKRLRALARLVRPHSPDLAKAVNTHCRAAGKALGPFRDRDAASAALEDLIAHFSPALDLDDFADLSRKVQARRAVAVDGATGLREALNFARADLLLAKSSLREIDWQGVMPQHIGAAIQRDYKSARKLLAKVSADRHLADAHEWRTALKYHWLQLRLMRPVWSGAAAAHQAHLRGAIDALGALQDLDVLLGGIERHYSSDGQRRLIAALADARMSDLIAAALEHGAPALEQKPKRLGKDCVDGLVQFLDAHDPASPQQVA